MMCDEAIAMAGCDGTCPPPPVELSCSSKMSELWVKKAYALCSATMPSKFIMSVWFHWTQNASVLA